MAVRVDEARQQGPAVEVDDFGSRPAMGRQHVGALAYRHDPAAGKANGLSARLRIVDCDNVADVDGLGGGPGHVFLHTVSSPEGNPQ